MHVHGLSRGREKNPILGDQTNSKICIVWVANIIKRLGGYDLPEIFETTTQFWVYDHTTVKIDLEPENHLEMKRKLI